MRTLLRPFKSPILRAQRSILRGFFGAAFSDSKYPLPVLWKCVFFQKVLGINRHVKWPVHWTSQIKCPEKIDRGTRMPGMALGCYLDGRNGICIGENTWIGPGVKIISMNHDVLEFDKFVDDEPIRIGRDCWLASNAVVLSGVELGDHTVVAAGCVVTRSFPEGDQVLAGIPAKVISKLDPYRAQGVAS